MIGVLLFLLGGLTNRFVRGGNVATRTENFLVLCGLPEKEVQKIVSADFLNFLIFQMTCFYFFEFWQALAVGIAMWVGAAPTWGQYITALRKNHVHQPYDRNAIFDYIPNLILRLDKGLLSGFVGLLLRGIFWGGLLAFAAGIFAPLFVGAAMPIIYLLMIKLEEKTKAINGWELAEFIMGGVLWTSVFYG